VNKNISNTVVLLIIIICILCILMMIILWNGRNSFSEKQPLNNNQIICFNVDDEGYVTMQYSNNRIIDNMKYLVENVERIEEGKSFISNYYKDKKLLICLKKQEEK
jgi:hypothetical protein